MFPFSNLLSAAFILFLFSCNNKTGSNNALLRKADAALMNSTNTVKVGNHLLYNSIESKRTDRNTKEKAAVWYPKMLVVKNICEETEKAIERIKKEVKENAGLQWKDNREAFDENDKNAAAKIDIIKLAALFEKHQQIMLGIDPEISKALILTRDSFALGFSPERFSNCTALEALVFLSAINSKLRTDENQVVSFCHSQMTPVVIDDEFPNFLVMQSSTILKPGQNLNIRAGIGIFSSYVQPVVKINGKSSPLKNFSNLASADIKVPAVPGKYKIPVSCTYVDENGNPSTVTKEVEYEVAEP